MLQLEYLLWVVNVLTKGPKISDLTTADILKLNLSHINGEKG